MDNGFMYLNMIPKKTWIKKLREELLEKLENIDNIKDTEEVKKIVELLRALDTMENDGYIEPMYRGKRRGKRKKKKCCCCDDDEDDEEVYRWWNTKEDIQILKGLTIGNEEYEDWQLLRKTFRLGVIKTLFGENQ